MPAVSHNPIARADATYALNMSWIILAFIVLHSLLILAAAALLMVGFVVGLQFWIRGRKIGCGLALADACWAYLRGRDGITIERVRQQLWENGHKVSFHQVERMAPSSPILRARALTLLANQDTGVEMPGIAILSSDPSNRP